MKPFLLLSHRRVDRAADDEYAAMLRCTGLEPSQLHRIRMERTSIDGLDPHDWSGIVLGGGPFNASDTEKSDVQRRVEAELLALLDVVVAEDLPFLGACYGVGILGLHQGWTVDGTYAEPVGGLDVTLTEAGRADPLFGQLPPTFAAYLGHKEAVRELPAEVAVLASTPTCPVHAFRVGAHVYATQFHPELDLDGLVTRVEVYRHAGYFAPDAADAVLDAARAFDVRHPPRLLRAFVERYADVSVTPSGS